MSDDRNKYVPTEGQVAFSHSNPKDFSWASWASSKLLMWILNAYLHNFYWNGKIEKTNKQT